MEPVEGAESPAPDLTALFAAEDHPMMAGVAFRAALAVAGVLGSVLWWRHRAGRTT